MPCPPAPRLQLIARIHTNSLPVRRLIHSLLVRIGRHHPQALMYPLLVAAKSQSPSRRAAAMGVMDAVRQHSATLVEQVRSAAQHGVGWGGWGQRRMDRQARRCAHIIGRPSSLRWIWLQRTAFRMSWLLAWLACEASPCACVVSMPGGPLREERACRLLRPVRCPARAGPAGEPGADPHGHPLARNVARGAGGGLAVGGSVGGSGRGVGSGGASAARSAHAAAAPPGWWAWPSTSCACFCAAA